MSTVRPEGNHPGTARARYKKIGGNVKVLNEARRDCAATRLDAAGLVQKKDLLPGKG